MRGFVLSLVAVLFLVFLFLIATSLHTHHLTMERILLFPQPLSYGAFAVDQTAFELNGIIGPDIRMNASNVSFKLSIRQDVPAENVSNLLEDYEDLLEETGNQNHAIMGANFTNLSDGAYDMTIAGLYHFTNGPDGQMIFRGLSGSTDAYSYEINVTVPKERVNLIAMSDDPSGINVSIRYIDLNGSVLDEVTVDPSATNSFIVDYLNGSSLEIGVGMESGNDGSLWIVTTNVTAQVVWHAKLPPLNESYKPGYEYDVWMNYSSGPYSVNRKIGT